MEKAVEERGCICIFISKFHCELNLISRVWCHAMKHVKANCNGTVPRLRKLVPESLSTVDVTLTKKLFGQFLTVKEVTGALCHIYNSTSSLNDYLSIAFCRNSSRSSFVSRRCVPTSLRSLSSTTGNVVRGAPALPRSPVDSKYVVMEILAGVSMGSRRM